MKSTVEIVCIPPGQDAGAALAPGFYFALPRAAAKRRARRLSAEGPLMFGPYDSPALARLIATSARALGLVGQPVARERDERAPARPECGQHKWASAPIPCLPRGALPLGRPFLPC